MLVHILINHPSVVRALERARGRRFVRHEHRNHRGGPAAPRTSLPFAGHATGELEVGLRVGRYVLGPMAAGRHSHYTRSYRL